MKYIVHLIIIIILCTFSYQYGKGNKQIKTIYNTDTIYNIDTITITKLVPQTTYIDHYITDTLYTTDSIYVPVQIPIETNVYKDSLHTVKFSGYKAQIEHFECYRRETIIQQEKVLEIAKKKPYIESGIQLGIGYGIFEKKPDIYVGYGIQINF